MPTIFFFFLPLKVKLLTGEQKATEPVLETRVQPTPRRGSFPLFWAGEQAGSIGVLFVCFARKVDGDSWFTWWFNHL